MELLLTGSTGFVGRNLLLRLLRDQRWKSLILPVRDPGKLRLQLEREGAGIGEKVTVLKVSDNQWELPSGANPHLVIHAAGQLFGREREGYFRTNVTGSLRLADQLSENTRMIVLSSLAAGGPTPDHYEARRIDHDDAPVSHYGESKLAMEQALRERLGSRLLILRPPMVLGPRDAATVPLFQMAKGLLRVKPGWRPKQYSWISVDDLCEALLDAAFSQWPDHQMPLYLAGSGTITDKQLLATAAQVIEARGVTVPVPQVVIQLVSLMLDAIPSCRDAVPSLGPDRVREILPDRWVCDGTDFSKAFDWTPRWELPATMQAAAEWLKRNGVI